MEDNCVYSFWSSSLHDICSYLTNCCPYSCLINVVYSKVLLPVQGLPRPGASLPQPHLGHCRAQPGEGVPAWICFDSWCLLMNKTFICVAPASSFQEVLIKEKSCIVDLDISMLWKAWAWLSVSYVHTRPTERHFESLCTSFYLYVSQETISRDFFLSQVFPFEEPNWSPISCPQNLSNID